MKDEKEPFRLDISFDNDGMDYGYGVAEDEPGSRGEVYFSNQAGVPNPFDYSEPPPRKKKARSHAGLTLVVILALALAVSAGLSFMGISFLQDIFAIGKNEHEVEFSIQANQSTDQVIEVLAANKLIRQKYLCKFYTSFTEWVKNQHQTTPSKPEYLAGQYQMNGTLGLEEMLNRFKSKPQTAETVHLLFPEGKTALDIVTKISNNRVASLDMLKSTMMETAFDYPFLRGLDNPGRYYKYEGYLFPDTYEFYVNDNVNSVLHRFFDNFQAKWEKGGFAKQAQEMGMTTDEVVILASIIQKEAANDKEMPLVSRILHNRLAHQGMYPYLECDSTRDYVLNNIAKEMDKSSAEFYNDLYNTYKKTGLPVGPICNPGLAAISAALNPEEGSKDIFYFQHDKNGKIYTAKTKAKHNEITTKLVIEGLQQ